MSGYIDGYEIIAILGIEPFELVQLAKSGDLRPFKYGIRVRDIEEKGRLEKTDEYKLHLLKLEEGAENAGKVSPVKWRGLAVRPGLKSEIRALEERGVQPRSLKDLTPDEWRNCFWERFDLPANEAHAEKVIKKFKSFNYLKEDLAKIYPESFYNDDTKVPEVETVKRRGENNLVPEDYVRKITVRYDNKEQFKIKIPGHPFKPIPYSALTRSFKDDNFKYLLEAIEKGTFHTSHRPSGLSFERGCFKLTNYIRKNYCPALPMKFKIYEKEGKTYRLIFQKEEDAAFDPDGKFEKLSKEEVIKEYKANCKKLQNPPEFVTDKDKRIWKNNLADEATELWLAAIKKGVKAEELREIIKKTGLDIEDLVEKENDSDNEFFDEGFQITSQP